MFDGMFDVRIATSSNIIDKIRKLQTKMAAKEVAMVVILSELADSDDEKPTRGPTRSWIKRRKWFLRNNNLGTYLGRFGGI